MYVALLVTACATAPQSVPQVVGVPVTKDLQSVTAAGFAVAPPQGLGWLRLTADTLRKMSPTYRIGFAKSLGGNSTALALVGAIAIPRAVNNPGEELRAFAESRDKAESEMTGVSGRLRLLSSRSLAMSYAGATCFRQDKVAEDRGVPNREGDIFTLGRHLLVCLHPDFPAYVIFADYSQRIAPDGPAPSGDDESESFLRGLEFKRLGKHVTTIAIGEKVQGAAHTPGAIWVAYGRDPGMVAWIDMHSNQVTARIQVGKSPVGAAAEDDAVWIVNNGDDTVSRIDPGTSKVVATIPVGKKPLEVAVGASAAWVTNSGGASVSRIDRATNQVLTIGGIGSEPSGIAFSQGAILATDYRSDRVVRIDPRTNAVSGGFGAGRQSNFILPDGDTVWVNDQNERAVLRLNLGQPDRGPFKIQAGVGKMPTGLAVDNHELWVANWGDDTLTAIDLRSTQAQARVLPSGSRPLVILVAERALWVTNAGDGTLLRLDP